MVTELQNSYVPKSEEQLLYVTFNQDASCIAFGTVKGFSIYKSSPFKEIFSRNLGGGIWKIEMLHKTNILALVGGGPNPKFDTNKLIIWDDLQGKVLTELCFYSPVKNVKLLRDKLFVVCDDIIFTFDFKTFENIDIIKTFPNPKGLIAVAEKEGNTIIAYPYNKGSVMVKAYNLLCHEPCAITAHESSIACLSLNSDGSLLCTASDKGTLLRIFKTDTGEIVQELRRGSNDAEIYCISFDHQSKFIACTSDKKTIHVFIVNTNQMQYLNSSEELSVESENNEDDKGEPKNHKSFLRKISKFFGNKSGYFNSEWSFAQLRLNETRSICAFSQEDINTLYIFGNSGKYYEVTFDPKNGGTCTVLKEKQLIIN